MSVANVSGSVLPEEMLFYEILRHLPPHTLAGRISLVCRKLREFALNPSFYEPYVKVIGKAEYELYADASLRLNFDGLPPIDRKEALALAMPLFGRLDKEDLPIDGDAGVAILDIPKNLSIETLNTFGAKVGRPVEMNGHLFRDLSFLPNYYVGAVPKAYRIVVSRSILTESLQVGMSDNNLQKECAQKVGCRLPFLIEVSALALMTFLGSSPESPVRLFPSYPSRFPDSSYMTTLCQDRIKGNKEIQAGAFEDSPLCTRLTVYFSPRYEYGKENAGCYRGAAVVREITPKT